MAINESTAAHGLERDRAYRGSERIIALLDIFGFESFQVRLSLKASHYLPHVTL